MIPTMQVVILAAGRGTRLNEAFGAIPKPLTPVCEEPLLQRLVLQLNQAGIFDITIVVGNRADQVIQSLLEVSPLVKFVYNERYKEDKNIFSMMCGLDSLPDKSTLMIESDSILSHQAMESFLTSLGNESQWSVCGKFRPGQIGIILGADTDGNLTEIKYSDYQEHLGAYYKDIGMIYLNEKFVPCYRKLLHEYAEISLDQYYTAPFVNNLSIMPFTIHNLGWHGGGSFNTINEYQSLIERIRPVRYVTSHNEHQTSAW